MHAGWITALAAGGATWFVATYLISISGASRELTEGFGSLFAALILVTVGIWMHGKSNAEVWQRYIREKMTTALSRRSGWFLFLLAFIVVYREVFETILFYTALWAQGNELALFGGAFCAMILLTIIAWIMLRYSARLPDQYILRCELHSCRSACRRSCRKRRNWPARGGPNQCDARSGRAARTYSWDISDAGISLGPTSGDDASVRGALAQ